MPPSLAATNARAAAEFDALCTALDISCLRFTRWGSKQAKDWGVSPDGLVQAALQLAYHRTMGQTPSTYESASTANFAAGRTETIRSATIESAAFVAAAVDALPAHEQAALLRASAARHSEVAREAAQGQGVDRHLYALRDLATRTAGAGGGEAGGESAVMPELLADPSYTKLASNELSTSTLTLEYYRQGVFGPVHPEGYGVSYHLPQHELRFGVSTYKPRSARVLTEALHNALVHIEVLLTEVPADFDPSELPDGAAARRRRGSRQGSRASRRRQKPAQARPY